MLKPGDLVARHSYGLDIVFLVERVDETNQVVVLKGHDVRLLADAPLQDVTLIDPQEMNQYGKSHRQQEEESLQLIYQQRRLQNEKNNWLLTGRYRNVSQYFEMPGKVLHVDGDAKYLQKCLEFYRELNIPVEGFHVPEPEMPQQVANLLPRVNPDILVITGHDGILKSRKDYLEELSSYRNSANFVKAVQVARQYERNRDVLTIIAGACQSHFEAILRSGANFASSPQRILIHALDPVLIAEKVAYTSIRETLNIMDVIKNTITGMDGIGGVESRGSYRLGLPNVYQGDEKKAHGREGNSPFQ